MELRLGLSSLALHIVRSWETSENLTCQRDDIASVFRIVLREGKFAAMNISFICTGNICRSPFAQLLLNSLRQDVEVSSAGIYALSGHPMDQLMAQELADRGVGDAGFRARQVDPAQLEADLILTMSNRQRLYLLDEQPPLISRIGLLAAVPSLVDAVPSDQALSPADIRAWARKRPSRTAEIADPYRQGPHAAATAAAQIDTLVRQLATVL